MKTTTLLLLSCALHSSNADSGYFLHLTDIHHDPFYSVHGIPPSQGGFCRVEKGKKANRPLGRYGEYGCDAPWALVEKSLDAAQRLAPDPKFILYTGDTLPHLNNSLFNASVVIKQMTNLTNEIHNRWPSVPYYPAFGNHDYWPDDNLPGHNSTIYAAMAQLWKPWIGEQPTMYHGGYYSVDVPNTAITAISLNTVILYAHDFLPNLPDDPGHMLGWLGGQLETVRMRNRKALIFSHVAPGFVGYDMIKPQYATPLLALLNINHDILLPLVNGHVHRDEFILIRDFADNITGVALLGPSVVPNPGMPSFRTIHFHTEPTPYFTDILTFTLNLTKANSQSGANFTEEYSMAKAYGLAAITPSEGLELCSIENANLTAYSICASNVATSSADCLRPSSFIAELLWISLIPLIFNLR